MCIIKEEFKRAYHWRRQFCHNKTLQFSQAGIGMHQGGIYMCGEATCRVIAGRVWVSVYDLVSPVLLYHIYLSVGCIVFR